MESGLLIWKLRSPKIIILVDGIEKTKYLSLVMKVLGLESGGR